MKIFLKVIPFLFLISTLICNQVNDCSIKCQCEENIQCISQTNSCCEVFGKSFFASRSQGNNTARNMMGIQEKIHKFGSCDFYGVATAAVEYQKMFRTEGIGNWFTTNGLNSMTYGLDYEANTAGNGTFDINAINFGVTGSGKISFCPQKSDVILDLFTYLGLDKVVCGLWVSVHIPIVHTKWNLNIQETTFDSGSSVYPEDSVGDGAAIATVFNGAKPMTEAFKGLVGFGDAPRLKNGRICGEQTATGVTGLRIDIGYDLIRRERSHFAVAIDFITPTGTQPRGEYLFEPIIGDQDRWQAGINVNAAWNFYKNCSQNNTLTLFFDGTVNHMFGHKNNRILGIKVPNATEAQKNWSYYLLLKKFDTSGNVSGLERAANVFTGPVKIKANVVGNLAFLLQWNCCNLMSGLGYELWARSKEILETRCFNITPQTYAIKGSSYYDTNLVAPDTTISKDGTVENVSTAEYLTNEDFDYCPALNPSAYSNKIFGFVGYNWSCHCLQPFVLLGAEAEFGKDNRAMSQWGVIAKTGLSF